MSAIVNISINLSKVEKAALIEGKKGKYLPLTIFINDEADEYGNNAAAIVAQTKEEREAKKPRVYLGNGKTVGNGEKTKSVEQESLLDELGI